MPLSFNEYYPGGPDPKFTVYHIWKCYDLICREGPVGRRAIARMIGLGEGSTRTLLDKMTAEGVVEETKTGCVLTQKGRNKLRGTGISIIGHDFQDPLPTDFKCAVLVRGKADRIDTGTEQRDDAVRVGAEGAITLVARDGKVTFPHDERFPDQKDLEQWKSQYNIRDGDVIIIAGAARYEDAERGAVTSALNLSTRTRRCWNEGTSMITGDTEQEDVKCIALAIHELVGRLPVTMRTKNHYGVRCEDGHIIETNYTGPVLEETLARGRIVRAHSKAGKYRGVPVLAVPLVRNNEVIAVVGVFDVTKGSYAEWIGRMRGD